MTQESKPYYAYGNDVRRRRDGEMVCQVHLAGYTARILDALNAAEAPAPETAPAPDYAALDAQVRSHEARLDCHREFLTSHESRLDSLASIVDALTRELRAQAMTPREAIEKLRGHVVAPALPYADALAVLQSAVEDAERRAGEEAWLEALEQAIALLQEVAALDRAPPHVRDERELVSPSDVGFPRPLGARIDRWLNAIQPPEPTP